MKHLQILFIVMILLSGCKKDEGFGTYYEFNYSDSLSAVVPGDSVHIVLIQLATTGDVSPNVPFDVVQDSLLLDTVRLNFDVAYGSYSPTPSPWKQDTVRNDTLFLWYPHIKPFNGFPKRSAGETVTEIQTSPLLPYYSVQRMHIRTSQRRQVVFHSKLAS